MSLLEDAKSIPVQKQAKTLAWLKDEVTLTQASKALHKNSLSGNTLYYFAAVIKEAYRQGKVVIK